MALLEGEDLSGELAVGALRNQKLFRFLGPSLICLLFSFLVNRSRASPLYSWLGGNRAS